MEDWRKSNITWDDKMKYVYDNNYLTDLTVKVSDGKTTRSFNAHKLLLSMSSDVLEEELRAECLRVPGEAVLNITAANPVAFEMFLKFVYCKNVNLKSIKEASDVIKVSIKFNVGELTRICLEYVERNLNIHTYMECAEFARIYNLKYLKSRCSDLVKKNTKLIITDTNIQNWNMEALVDILEQPSLQIREIDLFYLIEKWIKSKNYNDQSFRKKVRENIMPKFCFLGMSAEEFTTGPLSSGLLEKNESLAILGHIVADQCDVPYPQGFSQQTREIYSEPRSIVDKKAKNSVSRMESEYKLPQPSRSSVTTPPKPTVQFKTCEHQKKHEPEEEVKLSQKAPSPSKNNYAKKPQRKRTPDRKSPKLSTSTDRSNTQSTTSSRKSVSSRTIIPKTSVKPTVKLAKGTSSRSPRKSLVKLQGKTVDLSAIEKTILNASKKTEEKSENPKT